MRAVKVKTEIDGLEFRLREDGRDSEQASFGVLMVYRKGRLLAGFPVGVRLFRELYDTALVGRRVIDWEMVGLWGIVGVIAIGLFRLLIR